MYNTSSDVEYAKNVLIIFGSTCTSIGTVLGNGLIITAFIMEKKIRIPSNYFIASLAVTDILIGLFSMNLFSVYVVLGKWPLGDLLCNIWLTFDYTVCLTSQYTVLLITVDRYCSVKIPAKYRIWRTEKKVYLLIILAWIIPACLFISIIIVWNTSQTQLNEQCFAEFTLNKIFNTVFTIAYFWITLGIMCALYIGIYRVARRLHQNSDTKRKRLTSLMATAGQTMSKIGVGLSLANLDVNGQFKNFLKDDRFGGLTTEKNFFNDNCLYPDISKNNFSISSRISPSDDTNSLMVNNNNNIFPKSHSETLFTDSSRFSPYSIREREFVQFDDIRFIDDNSSNDSKTLSSNNKCYTNRYNLPSINISHSAVHAKFLCGNPREVKYKSWDNSVSKSALKALRFLKNVHNMSKRIDIRNHSKAKKSLKTISFILGAFIICWTPYHVLILIKGFCDTQKSSCINNVLYNASYWLCYINSPINPFCYALSNSQFKKTLIKLIKGDFTRS